MPSGFLYLIHKRNVQHMKYSLYLGKISGIRISVHWTFLILIVWIVFANMRSGLTFSEIVWSVTFVLTIFVCVILHELGHALTAQKFRIKTKEISILPIGGVAQLESIPENPKEELLVALAGPAVNILIAGLLYPFVSMGQELKQLDTLTRVGPENFFVSLMGINLWLALFNLIPAFPMDGGRVLRALLAFKLGHAKATRIAASIGQVLAMVFVFFGFFFNPFLIFIGFFIFLGAQAEAVYAQSRFLLKGFTVNDIVMHDVPFIDGEASIKEAVAKLLDGQNKNFVVNHLGKPAGTLSRDQIIKALGEQGENVSVNRVKDDDMVILTPEMPLEEAWHKLQQLRKPLMLVMSNGHLSGVVDEENLAEFILIQTAAKKANS
jgi:Zn-dependent protease/CBS domain-containing protein